MGTPKKFFVRKSLGSPVIAEKIRLLTAGKEMGQSLSLEKLPAILEETKTILLPFVEWLDKPLFSKEQFVSASPKAFQKKRGMRLLEVGFMIIWLERSGLWFVRVRSSDSKKAYHELDSKQLAKLMIEKSDDFLGLSLRDEHLLKEVVFLKDVALYDALVLHVLSLFFQSVAVLLKEREERFRVMRDGLNLLNDFTQSLDPLLSRKKNVSIKGYSIFSDTARGTSRSTSSDYLCPEILKQFWECIDNRRLRRQNYREEVFEYSFESLNKILQRVGWIVEEIEEAKKMGNIDANSLFGFNTGRLPFTKKELDALKKLVDSITT